MPHLRLGAVLMERPVGLYTLGAPRDQLGGYLVARATHQGGVGLKQRAQQHVAGQPHLVLPRHAEAGLPHHLAHPAALGLGQRGGEQQARLPQRTGHTDLVVPPVAADGPLAKPIAQGAVQGLGRGGRRSDVVAAGQGVEALHVTFGRPARPQCVGIVDVGPGAVGAQRGDEAVGLGLRHGIALLELDNVLVRHFGLARRAGE